MALECSRKWADFEGRLLMIGFGCIGSGVLPLLLRHINLRPEQITILGPCNRNQPVADAYGVRFESETITRENYAQVLEAHLSPGDFLLNLSVDVGSIDLAIWCQQHQVLYLDACIGPWVGGHFDVRLTPSQRSNYALRDQARALRETTDNQTTAILAHGVNPGLVSHFVKQALINLQRDLEPSSAEQAPPVNRQQWAALAERLGIKAIHIAERDTQTGSRRKRPGEFVNTWSIDGFVGEGCQPAELGWGTHERHWPDIARRHDFGNQAAIWLDQPGAATRVRSWTPLNGAYQGFLITHEESLSIAEYLTLEEDGRVRYRPTVHYAYHPCDDAILSLHELAGHNWKLQSSTRLLEASDIDHGMDELGVLLMGHARNVYWYGSRLTIDQARALCPYNTATSLQTAAGVLGGVIWAMLHPEAGVVDPDELDFEQVLEVAAPYLGEMVGVYGDWTPLAGRGVLFTEDLDTDDPWQFHNVLVH